MYIPFHNMYTILYIWHNCVYIYLVCTEYRLTECLYMCIYICIYIYLFIYTLHTYKGNYFNTLWEFFLFISDQNNHHSCYKTHEAFHSKVHTWCICLYSTVNRYNAVGFRYLIRKTGVRPEPSHDRHRSDGWWDVVLSSARLTKRPQNHPPRLYIVRV
jgi:hypothetical protein